MPASLAAPKKPVQMSGVTARKKPLTEIERLELENKRMEERLRDFKDNIARQKAKRASTSRESLWTGGNASRGSLTAYATDVLAKKNAALKSRRGYSGVGQEADDKRKDMEQAHRDRMSVYEREDRMGQSQGAGSLPSHQQQQFRFEYQQPPPQLVLQAASPAMTMPSKPAAPPPSMTRPVPQKLWRIPTPVLKAAAASGQLESDQLQAMAMNPAGVSSDTDMAGDQHRHRPPIGPGKSIMASSQLSSSSSMMSSSTWASADSPGSSPSMSAIKPLDPLPADLLLSEPATPFPLTPRASEVSMTPSSSSSSLPLSMLSSRPRQRREYVPPTAPMAASSLASGSGLTSAHADTAVSVASTTMTAFGSREQGVVIIPNSRNSQVHGGKGSVAKTATEAKAQSTDTVISTPRPPLQTHTTTSSSSSSLSRVSDAQQAKTGTSSPIQKHVSFAEDVLERYMSSTDASTRTDHHGGNDYGADTRTASSNHEDASDDMDDVGPAASQRSIRRLEVRARKSVMHTTHASTGTVGSDDDEDGDSGLSLVHRGALGPHHQVQMQMQQQPKQQQQHQHQDALINGSFDERESHESFLEALLQWRLGSKLETQPGAGQKAAASKKGHAGVGVGVSTSTVTSSTSTNTAIKAPSGGKSTTHIESMMRKSAKPAEDGMSYMDRLLLLEMRERVKTGFQAAPAVAPAQDQHGAGKGGDPAEADDTDDVDTLDEQEIRDRLKALEAQKQAMQKQMQKQMQVPTVHDLH